MEHLKYIQDLLSKYENAEVSQHISPDDTMFNQWYFDVGRSAVENVIVACATSGVTEVRKVLDLPCGHGRVLRHLVHLFPEAEFHACDLDKDGVDFCAANFGAMPVYSCEELTELDFKTHYDLIWIGSLFTHTSHDVTKRWLSHIARFLSPRGIIVATLHGRWCQYVHKAAPYIREEAWQKITNEYCSSGYGYHDYLETESHSYINGSYGISLAKPHVIIKDLESLSKIRIYCYRERAWVDHQDVVVFGSPGYDQLWPGM